MTGWLTGVGGLLLILLSGALAMVLDVPGGPAGWRDGRPLRWFFLALVTTVVALAVVASWLRLHP